MPLEILLMEDNEVTSGRCGRIRHLDMGF